MLFPTSSILGQLASISLLASLLQRCYATGPTYDTAYCSSLNNGLNSGKTPQYSIYQSQGRCYTYCTGYAYGVLLGKWCWCTDYAPGVSTTASDCADSCPGYPTDTCGNAASNLYEYIGLAVAPSGTEGGSTSSVASTTSESPVTVTAIPPPVTVVETPSTSSPLPSSSASSSSLPIVSSFTTSSTSTTLVESTTSTTPIAITTAPVESTTAAPVSTWIPTPVTSIETITNGRVMTVTITPTSSPGSVASETLTANTKSGKKSSFSGGQAAGLTIGLIAFVAIVAGIGYFCWRKRKQDRAMSDYGGISRQGSTLVAGAAQVPSRTMSENSRYVLATDGRAVYPAWENDEPGSRSSRLVPIDPRLDPYAGIYQQGGASRSHDSVNTISDGRDYSRRVAKPVLRATNPDPETPR